MIWIMVFLPILFLLTLTFGLLWITSGFMGEKIVAWTCGTLAIISFLLFIILTVVGFIILR